MESEQLQSVRSAAEYSHKTVKEYLEKPNDRATRLSALRDAKRLVNELQDGDDALFIQFVNVGERQEDDLIAVSLC